ncbi:MAG TPA: hypothetical protein VIJ68_02355 [Candidatus Saccharimonadales bacterium]
MLNPHFVILGVVISFAGNLFYLRDTLQGKNQPNRISWFMWTLAPLIAFAAELQQGVGLQALITFMAGFNPLLIVIASFVNKRAVWKLTAFDFACGILSLLGLVLWLLSGHGDIAIALSILADAFAALPTIAKSYTHPQSESWLNFFAAAIGAAITLLTIRTWDFANYAFPLYILGICIIFTLLIRFELGVRLRRLFAAA